MPHHESAKAPKTTDPLLGTTVADKYEIQSSLGGGGAGLVYKGRHIYLKKTVAVKVLFPHLAIREDKVLRFQQEALAVSRLDHPNIVSVLDFGQAEKGQPYLIMEYVEGTNLADLIASSGPLAVERALPIFIQICQALAHAHSKGLIHRDLKPSNIMLVKTPEGKDIVKLIDFGLVKQLTEEEDFLHMTQTGEVFGSPYYMSPEQIRAQKVDIRTDIYSMGILMYETLMGDPPFDGDDPHQVFSRQLSENPGSLATVKAPLHVRDFLELVILKAMAKDRAQRYQTMHELEEDLQFATRTPQGLERSGTTWKLFTTRLKGYVSASSKPALILGSILLALIGALAIITYAFFVPHGSDLDSAKLSAWQTKNTTNNISPDELQEKQSLSTYMLKRIERNAGANSDDYASELGTQAAFLLEAGRYADAESAFKKVLEIRKKFDGTASGAAAAATNNLATCYYNQGQFDLAKPLYEGAINTARAIYGNSWAELALPMQNLADIYSKQGKFDAARQLFKEALSIWKNQGLTESPEYLFAASQLADSYFREGKLANAQKLYLEILPGWQKIDGPQQQNAAACLSRLAIIANKQNQRLEAERYLQQELKVLEKTAGPNSLKAGQVLHNLADLLWRQGRWPEALQLSARARAIQARSNPSSGQ